MRIGIDARFYGSTGKGLGRYTERLITHLQRQAPADDQFVLFLRQENWDEFQPASSQFTKVLADFGWYSVAEQRLMPRLVRAAHVDLMHYPHFNVPLFTPLPFVVTIHDLILTHFPTRRATTRSAFAYWAKHMAYRITLSRAVSRAAHILTVSEFTKQDIQSYFGYDPKKISVAYEAVDPFPAPSADSASVLQRLGIPRPYLLYVGNAYPHKNLDLLIPFLQALPAAYATLQLVIVGRPDYFLDRLRRNVVQAGVGDRVHFPGYVSDADLGVLYRSAHAYIFPSLYEGFGLPPLEAMAQGTPVIAANASCLPEILGPAALYFDPQNPRGMLAALEELDADPARRQELVAAGRERVQRYSWQALAKTTLRTYHSAILTHP